MTPRPMYKIYDCPEEKNEENYFKKKIPILRNNQMELSLKKYKQNVGN